jgi:nitrite reductase/ring-hydroxylating ferredoxin subunit
MAFAKAAKVGDVAEGTCKGVTVNGRKLALYKVSGKFYATAEECNHRGGPLSEGSLSANEITCPWHGGKFDVCTGAPLGGPVHKNIEIFPVRVEGDDIEIDVES